jgi:membrane fusion protein, heavy metal efflux system
MKAWSTSRHWLGVTSVALAMASCSGEAPKSAAPKAEAPAKLSGTTVKEAELTSITLTEDAERRLGIRIEAARAGQGSAVRQFAGEVTAPVGSSVLVSSPVAGTLQARGAIPTVGSMIKKDQPLFTLKPFLPLPRDLKASAEGDVAQARTRVETARQRKARADRMLADQVGTVRAQEEAQQELALATTALEVAENRLRQVQLEPFAEDVQIPIQAPQDGLLRQVFVASGQTVNAGASVFEVTNLNQVWIRVPVYAGEAQELASNSTVTVQALNRSGRSWTAQPVAAPPTASSASSTVDLYFQLPNDGLRFKPGEKVSVSIRSRGSRAWVEVPWSAIAYDTNGGTWVYESLGERHYRRRRVSLDHSSGGKAFLSAGVPAGTNVVADGAAELWGFEFGTGK